jgi:hypothetical protein
MFLADFRNAEFGAFFRRPFSFAAQIEIALLACVAGFAGASEAADWKG